MKLKVNKVNLTAKSVGITLKAFDPGRNRSLNNDFDSIKLRKNFVQKDKSLGMVLKTVPQTETSLDIKIRDKSNEKMVLRRFDTGKSPFKRAGGNKPFTFYYGLPVNYLYNNTIIHDDRPSTLFSDDFYEAYGDTGDFRDGFFD